VSNPAVVKDPEVLEDRVGQLDAGLSALAIEEPDLQAAPEGLGGGVVMAVADRGPCSGDRRRPAPVPGAETPAHRPGAQSSELSLRRWETRDPKEWWPTFATLPGLAAVTLVPFASIAC
jgi:hypothetical protein